MIGIDAAEITYIREHLSILPNFRRILESEVRCDLDSSAHLLPGSVWPGFFTEKTPGEHGFYLIMAWDSEMMRLSRVTPDWLSLEPFWRELAGAGVRTIAVDVPMTFAPPSGPGVEVINWGAHQGLTNFAANPAWLTRELRRRFGENSLGPEIPVDDHTHLEAQRARDRVKELLIASAERKVELTLWLAKCHDWDLFLTVFGEAHRAGHVLWPVDSSIPKASLLEVYLAIDQALGRLVEFFISGQATIGVFALHGMGPNDSQRHFVPRIVARVNRLWAYRSGAAVGSGAISDVRSDHANFLTTLRGQIPSCAKTAIARFIPLAAKDYLINRLYTAGYDWRTTPAVALKSDGNGFIRLNLRGREHHGILDPEGPAVSSYLTLLNEAFSSFQTQFGLPLISGFYDTREVAAGPRAERLPDVVITWQPQPAPVKRINSPQYGSIVADPDRWRTGTHRAGGFLAMLNSPSRGGVNYPPVINVARLPSLIRSLLYNG